MLQQVSYFKKFLYPNRGNKLQSQRNKKFVTYSNLKKIIWIFFVFCHDLFIIEIQKRVWHVSTSWHKKVAQLYMRNKDILVQKKNWFQSAWCFIIKISLNIIEINSEDNKATKVDALWEKNFNSMHV